MTERPRIEAEYLCSRCGEMHPLALACDADAAAVARFAFDQWARELDADNAAALAALEARGHRQDRRRAIVFLAILAAAVARMVWIWWLAR